MTNGTTFFELLQVQQESSNARAATHSYDHSAVQWGAEVR